MARHSGRKNYCCYVAEMFDELGVTRKNVYETKKVILRAVKALIDAEIEHLETVQRRESARRADRKNGNGATAPDDPEANPFEVPLTGFEKRRRA